MAVRALFFDFDGVLWDSEVAALQSWQETFAEHEQRMPFDVFATTLGTLEGEDPIDELERLVRWPIDREEIAAHRWDRKMELVRQLRPRPGVLAYIEEARERGLALAVVSTGDSEWIMTGLEILGLSDAWDFIECADGDVTRAKPSLRPSISRRSTGSASERMRPSRSRTRRTGSDPPRTPAFTVLRSPTR